MNIWSEMYRKAKQVQNSIAGPLAEPAGNL